MIAAWVLFPLVLLAVCLGCGLAVERVAGWRLAGAVIASVGLALVIVVATLMTYKGSTAKFTTAVVVLLALAGYASSIGRVRELRPERFSLAVGLGLYAVLAAPQVLSGNATFLGYFDLNDSAFHFALIDQLLAHGRDLSGVHPSSLRFVLNGDLSTDYPIGADVALGAVRPLVAQNIAWIFQPFLAVILSLGGVAIYQLLDGVVRSRPLRALCPFVAAQPGLVYGFYLEASIKELATTWLITLTVVLVLATLNGALGVRRLAPLALVTVAAFDVLNVAIVPWLGVPLAVFALLALWRTRQVISRISKRRLALVSGACLAVLAAIALPVIATAGTSFQVVSNQLTRPHDLGNLSRPLSKWQMLGIWPSGDFTLPVKAYDYRIPHALVITTARGLIVVAVISSLLGAGWAWRQRASGPLLLLVGSGLAAIYLLSRASPYASAKVMMIFSLAVMLTAMLGAVALHDFGRRAEGRRWRRAAVPTAWVLALVLTVGVLWTNVEAYRGMKLAPRARFAELAAVGTRFSGQGPALFNLGDEFAIHFLRSEAPTDPAYQTLTPRLGLSPRTKLLQTREPWNLDELSEPYVQSFPLLVLGRSPLNSRPPSDYRLAYRGRFYDVWRRTAMPHVLEHLPLGAGLDPAAVPRCAAVMALAGRASHERARLAYVTRAPLSVLLPTQAQHPPNFEPYSLYSPQPSSPEPYSLKQYDLFPRRGGAIAGAVRVRSSDRYEAWLQGSFTKQVQTWIDGRKMASASYEIGPLGQFLPMGRADLSAGAHQLSIRVPDYPGSWAHLLGREGRLAPGEATKDQMIGPLVLDPSSDTEQVAEVEPARAHSLCGLALDWIEIVR
jgi:hypothetical protein